MTEPLTATDEVVLRRRRFLRSGALLAAAAGGAVAASAGSALPAAAATGDSLKLGQDNPAGGSTSVSVVASDTSTSPTLRLTNTQGPTLQLTSIGEDFAGNLASGAILTTDVGPYLGLPDGAGGSITTTLVTGIDLELTPVTKLVAPYRAWDSKAKKGKIVARSSKGAVDSKGRLVKGSWVDVEVDSSSTDAYPLGAFLVLGSAKSSKDGYLLACDPDDFRKGTISLSFLKGKTLSGSTLSKVGVHGTSFVVRVFASQTTYVTLDVTGFTVLGFPGPDFTGDLEKTTLRARKSAVARARRAGR